MSIIESQLKKLDQARIKLHQKSRQLFPWYFVTTLLGFLISFLLTSNPPVIFLITFVGWLISRIINFVKVDLPFDDLKLKYKSILIAEFMRKYHPSIQYEYIGEEKYVRTIIRDSNLVSANVFEEEDVITGKLRDAEFYLSEIELKKRQGKSTHDVFEGLLFRLRVKNKSFTPSRIQSELGILDSVFGGFKKHPDYGFYYETRNEDLLNDQLGHAYSFIQYLMSKGEKVMIKTRGDEILVLLETEMKFLDDPKISLKKSLINKAYFENMGKQMNSLLLMLETFAHGYDENQILERLELKTLEKVKLGNDWEEF